MSLYDESNVIAELQRLFWYSIGFVVLLLEGDVVVLVTLVG